MKVGRVDFAGKVSVAVEKGGGWVPLDDLGLSEYGQDLLALLRDWESVKGRVEETLKDARPRNGKPLIPFRPLSFRDFMLWERHYVQAKLGLIRTFRPALYPLFKLPILGRSLKPPRMFYERPVYYVGNHLQMYTDGDVVPYPSYTRYLDYEFELGLVIVKGGRNPSPEEAEGMVGGVVILNDFTARDMQVKEFYESPFGPVVKAKNFATSISSFVIPASEILPRFTDLRVRVYINGELVSESTTANPQHLPRDMVAYAGLEENLYPGELLGTGTVPDSCGVEIGRFLKEGDEITLELVGFGSLTNRIGGRT